MSFLSSFIQLTKVNTVVFTVRATDADNDKIIYAIDQTSVSFIVFFLILNKLIQTQPSSYIFGVQLQPNAEYFKIDLPNSGRVILSKPLDFETKPLLTVTVFASVCWNHLVFL